MRKMLYAVLLTVTSFSCKAQSSDSLKTEFTKNNNGLIYSEMDMNALRFVVDSLNLRFKSCDLNKIYYSYPQAKAYSIRFASKTNDLSAIIPLLESNTSLSKLVKNYSNLIDLADSNLLVVQLPERENGKLQYISGNAAAGFDSEYRLEGKQPAVINEWIFNYEKKSGYQDYYSISGIYIVQDFKQPVITDKYAKLIQYVDCMIDTSAKVFLTDSFSNRYSGFAEENTVYKELNNYLNNRMKLKKSKLNADYDYINDKKIKFVGDSLRKDAFVIKKVNQLADWYTKKGGGNNESEELIAIFISKQKALQLKRSRRVMGMCSMDQSPRTHARNIAMLAAETHSWDIFLRTHLDIMNDRFDRVSDGSYAWGKRQTYIKELEALDINVTDMMLGLSLRAYNVAPGHYDGTVWRIGKALGESNDRAKFEETVKKIMQDETLDQFNRSLMFLLYHTYLNYLTDKTERTQKAEALKKEIGQYPSFIQDGINQVKTVLTD